MEESIRTIAVYALPVLFAITLQEAARGYAARYFGDNTAHAAGRLSLNPLMHIDIWGTVVIPIVLFMLSGFVFGYAKPVPVDYGRLRNPKRDMAWVALAGPAANFIMAVLWLILGALLVFFQVGEEFPNRVAQAGIVTNLLVMAFNLLPIPPFGGGQVLISVLPHRAAYAFSRIEPYGFFIVLGLAILGVMKYWLVPVMTVGGYLVQLAATPFTFFLL